MEMSRTTILTLLLFTGLFFVVQAEESQMSSSELLSQGDSLFDQDRIEEAMGIYTQAETAAQTESDLSNLTEARAQIARCHLRLGDKEQGRPWLEKAKETASPDQPEGWARYLGVRGRFEWKDKQEQTKQVSPVSPEAAATFGEMYDFSLEHNLHRRAVDAANMLAITDERNRRIEWALKGIDAAEKGNLKDMLGPLWNNLGWAYEDMGKYRESLDALSNARRYFYLKGEEGPMLIADWSVGHALRMCGEIDSALAIMEPVQRWAMIRKGENTSPETAEWLGFADEEMGELMIIKGNHQRAVACFRGAYNNFKEAGMDQWDPAKLNATLQRLQEVNKMRR